MEQENQKHDPETSTADVKVVDIHPDDRIADHSGEQAKLDVHISREFIQPLQKILRHDDNEAVYALLEDLHAADVADILEVLSSRERLKLIELLGDKLDPGVLTEVEGEAQDELYENIPNEQIADAVTELETVSPLKRA
jgi:magnesium transporter